MAERVGNLGRIRAGSLQLVEERLGHPVDLIGDAGRSDTLRPLLYKLRASF
eukprot:gene19594-20042_t